MDAVSLFFSSLKIPNLVVRRLIELKDESILRGLSKNPYLYDEGYRDLALSLDPYVDTVALMDLVSNPQISSGTLHIIASKTDVFDSALAKHSKLSEKTAFLIWERGDRSIRLLIASNHCLDKHFLYNLLLQQEDSELIEAFLKNPSIESYQRKQYLQQYLNLHSCVPLSYLVACAECCQSEDDDFVVFLLQLSNYYSTIIELLVKHPHLSKVTLKQMVNNINDYRVVAQILDHENWKVSSYR